MKSKIIAAGILGVLIAAGIIVRPYIVRATSNGNFISSKVQTGSFTITGDGTQTFKEGCDTYSPSFTNTPQVYATAYEVTGGSLGAFPPAIEVYGQNTTGLCVRVGTRDNSNIPNNFTIGVSWMAVGN